MPESEKKKSITFAELFGESSGSILKDIFITDIYMHDNPDGPVIVISYTRRAYGFGQISVRMSEVPMQDEDTGEHLIDPKFEIDTEHSDAVHTMAVWMKALQYMATHGVTECDEEHLNELRNILPQSE